MFTSAIKKQTSVGNWKSGITKKKRKKESNFIVADVSCLTNCPFYMRTLSLRLKLSDFYFLYYIQQVFGKFYDIFCRLRLEKCTGEKVK